NSLLKQGKPLAAVTAMHDAIQTFLKSSLMQNERKEFTQLVEDAVYRLNSNPHLRELYPVLLEYKPGKEKDLLQYLREIIDTLQEDITAAARESYAELEKRKQKDLQEGRELVQKKDVEKADAIFRKLEREHEGDFDLKIEIADIWLNAEEYTRAIDHLKNAYKENPSSVHIFNRLGMALRKLNRVEDAEKAYKQALKLGPGDEYLHFNLGRLYLENKMWDKAIKSAERALEINPDFTEAEKMYTFARKKIQQS
ncbi:MAG: tetratricopeptide repeat protein, partial [Desulfonatronovibrionaceae bacterium]